MPYKLPYQNVGPQAREHRTSILMRSLAVREELRETQRLLQVAETEVAMLQSELVETHCSDHRTTTDNDASDDCDCSCSDDFCGRDFSTPPVCTACHWTVKVVEGSRKRKRSPLFGNKDCRRGNLADFIGELCTGLKPGPQEAIVL